MKEVFHPLIKYIKRRFSFLQPQLKEGKKHPNSTVVIEKSKQFKFFLSALLLVFLLAVVTSAPFLLLLFFFLLLFLIVNHFYLLYITRKVNWKLSFENQKVFPKDANTFLISIENAGRLPILLAETRVKIDAFENSLQVKIGTEWSAPDSPLEDSLQIFAKTKAVIPYTLLPVKRGTANVSSLEIKMYDFFQLSYVKIYQETNLQPFCLIYAEADAALRIPPPQTEGEAVTSKPFALSEDLLVRGSRPYQAGDALNRINWKLTAKERFLQTKEFEKKQQPKWTMIINLNEADQSLFILDELELVLSQAVYLCRKAVLQQTPFELFMNQKISGAAAGMHVQEGSGKPQLSKIMERLARIRQTTTTVPIERVIQQVKTNQKQHRYILHFGPVSAETAANYSLMRRRGAVVKIIPFHENG